VTGTRRRSGQSPANDRCARTLTDTLETRFNASSKGEPVALALRHHDLKRMRDLLDAQPELVGRGDRRSSQPIHWATMTRQLDAIDELVRRGADINARRMDGARPIHLTAQVDRTP
jgi:ankyrin repeat protein